MSKLKLKIVLLVSMSFWVVHFSSGQYRMTDYVTKDADDMSRLNREQMGLVGNIKSIQQSVFSVMEGQLYRTVIPKNHYIWEDHEIVEYPGVQHFFFESLHEMPSEGFGGYENSFFEFDQLGNKTKLIIYKDNTETSFEQVEYFFDERSNLRERILYRDGMLHEKMDFTYNEKNELVSEITMDASGVVESSFQFDYEYDNMGRITKKTVKYLEHGEGITHTEFISFEYSDVKNEIYEVVSNEKGKKLIKIKKSFNDENMLIREEWKEKKNYRSRRFNYNDQSEVIYDSFYWSKGLQSNLWTKLNIFENGQLSMTMETGESPSSYEFPIVSFFSFEVETLGTLFLKEFEYDTSGNWTTMNIYLAATQNYWPGLPAVYDDSTIFQKKQEFVKLEFHPIYTVRRQIDYYPDQNTAF